MKHLIYITTIVALLVGCNGSKHPKPEPDNIREIEFKALTLHGSEYLGASDSDNGRYNYYVVLSKVGLGDDGVLYDDSEYYFFDLYSDKSADDSDNWTLPNGYYTFDNGGIGCEYSYRAVTDGNDEAQETYFTSASVNVNNNGISAELHLESGETVYVRYAGKNTIKKPQSTLNKSIKFTIDNAKFAGQFVDESVDTNGRKEYAIVIMNEEGITDDGYAGELFQLTLHVDANATDIVGEYTQERFVKGDIIDDELYGSWYMTIDEKGAISERAPFISGSINIEKNDADKYIFDINVTDDARHTIMGTITATDASR